MPSPGREVVCVEGLGASTKCVPTPLHLKYAKAYEQLMCMLLVADQGIRVEKLEHALQDMPANSETQSRDTNVQVYWCASLCPLPAQARRNSFNKFCYGQWPLMNENGCRNNISHAFIQDLSKWFPWRLRPKHGLKCVFLTACCFLVETRRQHNDCSNTTKT